MINLANRYKGIVFYNPAECRCIMDIRTVELIQKDLEVLETFKKLYPRVYIGVFNNKKMYFLRIMGYDIFITKEIYDTLKEWCDEL